MFPVYLFLGGSMVLVPTWFVTFLPIVVFADPRSHWVRPSFLGALMTLNSDGPGNVFGLGMATCGILPGLTYGIWNRRYIGRDSFA
mgnify:CR=1 FL=1